MLDKPSNDPVHNELYDMVEAHATASQTRTVCSNHTARGSVRRFDLKGLHQSQTRYNVVYVSCWCDTVCRVGVTLCVVLV